jgi:hypothetical protein
MHFKRHELKYYLNEIQCQSLIGQISSLLKLDPHSPKEGYLVKSLYFDSHDDECLYEKQSGLYQRQKIRLRTYDNSKQLVKFEIKRKKGQLVMKDSATISAEDAKQVCLGNRGVLLNYRNKTLNEIYTTFSTKHYTPKVIVEYRRLAYILPASNVRITFDLNLRSSINNTNIFSSNSPSIPTILEGKQILEVKYDEFLPSYIKKVLSSVNSERMAISKYTLCRRFHKINKWEDN